MKKYLLLITMVLALALTLTACGCRHVWFSATCEAPQTCQECGATEGEALGHSWTEATCDSAKTCSRCKLTEGEPLGHTWEEATTEAPKTCTVCKATEGEKISVDPRFTTAATKDIQGRWFFTRALDSNVLGIDGIESDTTFRVVFEFTNDGIFRSFAEVDDEEAVRAELVDILIEFVYVSWEAEGISREQGETIFKENNGETFKEYAEATVNETTLNELLAVSNDELVYYVEDACLYTAYSWDDAVPDPLEFTISGDTLTLHYDFLDTGLGYTEFTRMP